MQHLRRSFADLSRNIGLADEVITLRPDRRAAPQPMQAGDVQDQTEHYLDITTGSSRGLWTGMWAWGTLIQTCGPPRERLKAAATEARRLASRESNA